MELAIPSIAMADLKDLRIVYYPDTALRIPGKALDRIDDRIRQVAARMVELMHQARGVGLAGPQVGLAWRLFVSNPTGEPGQDQVFINPRLRDHGRQAETREEGCLSLPNINAQITRPVSVIIEAINEHGEPFTLSSDSLPARIWQHECDHLDGILITDRMTLFDKMANRSVLRELEQKAKK